MHQFLPAIIIRRYRMAIHSIVDPAMKKSLPWSQDREEWSKTKGSKRRIRSLRVNSFRMDLNQPGCFQTDGE